MSSETEDGRSVEAQIADLRQRQQRHREIIGKLCKRVMELEDQDKTAQEKIRDALQEDPTQSEQELADEHDVTESYVKQIKNGTI